MMMIIDNMNQPRKGAYDDANDEGHFNLIDTYLL